MRSIKENSRETFNQQAATYDKDIKGAARPLTLSLSCWRNCHTYHFQCALDLGCGDGGNDEADLAGRSSQRTLRP